MNEYDKVLNSLDVSSFMCQFNENDRKGKIDHDTVYAL